jgi:hypothetical protein
LWRFVLPFRLQIAKSVTTPLSFQIEGETFGLVRYSDLDVEQRAAIDPLTLQARFHGETIEVMPDETFVVAEKAGRASGEAWDNIASAFDLFRGAIEYVFDQGVARLLTTRQSRARMCHIPPWSPA